VCSNIQVLFQFIVTVQVKSLIFAINNLSVGLYGKEYFDLSLTKSGQLYSLINEYGQYSQG
jgi:hypothetical protein